MVQIRRMPRKWSIVSLWEPLGVFDIELDVPHCWACGWEWIRPGTDDLPLRDQWNKAILQRAHLVDRHKSHDDSASNLALLCELCHLLMPSFSDWGAAIAWVTDDASPLMRFARKELAEVPPDVMARALAEA